MSELLAVVLNIHPNKEESGEQFILFLFPIKIQKQIKVMLYAKRTTSQISVAWGCIASPVEYKMSK